MYLFYIISSSFILLTILYEFVYDLCFNKKTKKIKNTKNTKNTKIFDFKKKYSFEIKNIEFCNESTESNESNESTESNFTKLSNYNNIYMEQNDIKLKVNILFDYYVVNYIYNNIEYKYYSNNNILKFPIYKEEQIKNYVYINRITKAILVINENIEYDILAQILPFLGPNYNFYKDLDIKLSIKSILKYIYIKDKKILKEINFDNKNYYIKLYDNFNNEYYNKSDYLNWNAELQL